MLTDARARIDSAWCQVPTRVTRTAWPLSLGAWRHGHDRRLGRSSPRWRPSRVTTSLTQLERAALALGVASESDDLLSWNNDPNRIKQDVLGAFLALASVDRLDHDG